MLKRDTYLGQIASFIDKPLVKVLTGIRRCGKSSVLLLLRDELMARGVLSEQIIFITMESFSFSVIQNEKSLYSYVKKKIKKKKRYYLLLDEVQEIEGWEKAINSFLIDFNIDIYLTGSNARLLSGELATYLTGRYVEISVFTLSFNEYLNFRDYYLKDEETKDVYGKFKEYIRKGGFPLIHTAQYSAEAAEKIVFDIYSSVLLHDTVHRFKIREIELLQRVVKYVFDNIGNTFSGKNVADYFKSQQRKIDINTVYNYLSALEAAFVFYRVPRYDIKGKEILKTQEKFYTSDVSLLYALLGYKDSLISGVLENMVFLELLRRNYKVFVGKFDNKEIDFVAEKQGEKIYVQVTYKMDSSKTAEREFSALLSIKDQYPKYVVSMDDFWKDNIEGVKHFHIADFLLKEQY